MGGIGSGGWSRYDAKPTEENFHSLSMSFLKKHEVIGWRKRSSGSWSWSRNGEVTSSVGYQINLSESPAWLRVHYTNTRTKTDYDYKIYLATTKPHYGGKRWWFLCPAVGCDRRVGVLYLGKIFACRHCHNMAYSSQNEAPHYRMLYKAQKLHRRLGGSGVADDYLLKPKGMHWRTFNRKMADINRLSGISNMMMYQSLSKYFNW